ncbi:OsmC family protein [Saccharothrix saharensis]|uniref:OsmC family protein n=1 Tax=Saccharothrix saharensis TaxID=571190 RepID=UPI00114EFDD1|nr:hypothetical protein [Saccharothrix saharensis]
MALRDHLVPTDRPQLDGGADVGPGPVELLVGSMAACTATTPVSRTRTQRPHGEVRDVMTGDVATVTPEKPVCHARDLPARHLHGAAGGLGQTCVEHA